MSIFTKLKTATDFSASVIKEGFALIWPEKSESGTISLKCKLDDGSVQEISGGGTADLSDAVMRYPATVDAETGVVSVTDGTPVEDVRIGDEIVTPNGVYKKTTDSIEIEGNPSTGDLVVSGITTPSTVNGTYTYQSENLWKNESAGYWFDLLDNLYWRCTSNTGMPMPSSAVFYSKPMSSGIVMPWEIPAADWIVTGSGTPVVESLAGTQTVTNTIELFEYASYPGDGVIDQKISTHNSALNAHPMQFSGETDFNNLTQGGSFYLSAGDSLQNAPANGTFFVIIKNWTSGDITRIFQQVYRLQPNGVHRFYTRHGNKASGAAEITWSSWMTIGYNAFISAPNYGAGVDIKSTLQQGVYDVPSAGWIYATAKGVSISGNLIGDVTKIVLPVAAGDTITADMVTIAKFYPNR